RSVCAILIALPLTAASPAAFAQLPLLAPAEQPAPFVREAFATPYGRALTAELGKSLFKNADPACLQAKNLTAEPLTERGGELIAVWGVRAVETLGSFFDAKAHEAKFTASAGQNALAELARLRENADVKRYLEVERPWRLTKLADFIFEQFDRYLLI